MLVFGQERLQDWFSDDPMPRRPDDPIASGAYALMRELQAQWTAVLSAVPRLIANKTGAFAAPDLFLQ